MWLIICIGTVAKLNHQYCVQLIYARKRTASFPRNSATANTSMNKRVINRTTDEIWARFIHGSGRIFPLCLSSARHRAYLIMQIFVTFVDEQHVKEFKRSVLRRQCPDIHRNRKKSSCTADIESPLFLSTGTTSQPPT